MKSILILIFSLFIMVGCTNKSKFIQCQVYQIGIDKIEPNSSYFLNSENDIYFIGSKYGDIRDLRTSKIFIGRSKTGKENKWRILIDSIPGECKTVSQTEDYIYLVSVQHGDKSGNPAFDKHTLYRISKEKGAAVELYEWKDGSLSISEINFQSENIGYLYLYSHKTHRGAILQTLNGGIAWKELNINTSISTPKYVHNNIYFFSKKNQISSSNLKGVLLDSINFNLNITDFAVEAEKDYWLLGEKGEKTILQHYKNDQMTLVKTFSDDPDVFPDRLYKYKDLIVVLTGKIDEDMLSGFGGTKTSIFVSRDNGETWSKPLLQGLIYFNPISFYKDERMTAYALKGRILKCQFKK